MSTYLKFAESTLTLLSAFSYANWAGCPDDRRLTKDLLFSLVQIISWINREVEYKSWANATTELMWVQTLLDGLGVIHSPVVCLWCVNIGATYSWTNPVFHSRTRHIKIGYHFVRESVAKRLLDISFYLHRWPSCRWFYQEGSAYFKPTLLP